MSIPPDLTARTNPRSSSISV